ncbi:MAG: DUF1232 domain-containing protein [Xanthomonadales bacterium]|nr:DUF1232 domain-containing protein [Gammaproteobacteria bacterium]NNE04815.1 DUF1232 domain-containing protein [Xanthomonadales bacterium]NNL93979.1 DUF1232 domain-containing protein [Xanthomonadales bacterium]
METSRIEALITEHCDDEQAEGDLLELLSVVADRNGADPGEKELKKGARFVLGYIKQVPYMLKVATTAADNVGLNAEMEHILEMVRSYWAQDLDVIPDHLGVIGLLDDAYCSLTSLQAVSDHYQLQTGKYLFPDDLTAANRMMRQIIGEPYITDLDRFVTNAIREAGVMQAMKALASPDKQQHFASQANIWNHGPVGEVARDHLAELGLN